MDRVARCPRSSDEGTRWNIAGVDLERRRAWAKRGARATYGDGCLSCCDDFRVDLGASRARKLREIGTADSARSRSRFAAVEFYHPASGELGCAVDERVEGVARTRMIARDSCSGAVVPAQVPDGNASRVDGDDEDDERPVHSVTLSPFFLCKHGR